MTDVVIVSAARTAIGSFGGALSSIAAHELGATVIRAALDRAAIEAADVSDVVLGHVLTAGQGQNTARQASMRAGIPMEKAALTINQVCGSGLVPWRSVTRPSRPGTQRSSSRVARRT
jgi:acetyl-CoA C-acetyltransferase